MAAAPPPPVFNDGGAALLAELAAAARDGVRKLDLGGRGLTALPPEIGTLTSLEELNCADNLLDDLPDALEGCSSLRVLFFLRCRFTRVPRVVGRLPSLFMLSFKSNLLEEVGEDALPPSLGWLILTDNRLRALPASLGRLPLLRKLMLASNALGDLPDLRGLRALELLRVSDNRLGGGALCALHALPRLAWLAVAGNDAPPVRAGDALAVLSRAGAPRLRMSDVRVGAVLGEGASGVVYAAALLAGGEGGAARVGGAEGAGGEQPVALKVFKAASSDGRPIDEVVAAVLLSPHPNLVNLLGFVAEDSAPDGTPGRLATVLQLATGCAVLARPPSFASVTRDVYPPGALPAPLLPAQAAGVARGVAAACAHMHAHGVAHGDVYAHNVFVDPALLGPSGAASAAPVAASTRLGDLGAAFAYHCGGDDAAAFERLEVRAWGCLVEELLALCTGGEGGGGTPARGLQDALRSLVAACDSPVVAQRPSFVEVLAGVDAAIAQAEGSST